MAKREYRQVGADETLEDDCRQLIRLAVREDLDRGLDWTTVRLIGPQARGRCDVIPRVAGVCAGLVTTPWVLDEMDADLQVELHIRDGQPLVPGEPILSLEGNARDLLTCERLVLNLLCRLCGVATLTSKYVKELAGTTARLYDTRKTTPGWRRLEKYAVRLGGACNHRTGLFDGFLIKDNNLALGGIGPAEAVRLAQEWAGGHTDLASVPEIVEVEVDSLDQLAEVLPTGPDIVLVDNFTHADLKRAVELRDKVAPQVELEASGNVRIDTLRAIAATGVERISSGALTHQAVWLDLGLDYAKP